MLIEILLGSWILLVILMSIFGGWYFIKDIDFRKSIYELVKEGLIMMVCLFGVSILSLGIFYLMYLIGSIFI